MVFVSSLSAAKDHSELIPLQREDTTNWLVNGII